MSRRTDLSEVPSAAASIPPVNAPDSSLQYGDATRLQQGQQQVPIPQSQTPSPMSSGGGMGAGLPADMSLLQFPTQEPDVPITTGVGDYQRMAGPGALAMKVDMLSHLVALPFVGSEIQEMLDAALVELHESQAAQPPTSSFLAGPFPSS